MKKTKLITIVLAVFISIVLAACSTVSDYPIGGGNGTGDYSSSVQSVVLSPTSWLLEVGESVELSATVNVTGEARHSVTWQSSNTDIARISGNGNTITVRAHAVGAANITATSVVDSTKSATTIITVIPVAEIDDDLLFEISPVERLGFEFYDYCITDQAETRGYRLSSNPHRYEITYYTRRASAAHGELANFGAHNNTLFPGALVNLDTLTPISVQRAPIDISLDAEGWLGIPHGASLTTTINNPNLGNTRQGISDLVNGLITPNTNILGRLNWSMHEINSVEDLNLTLGGNFRGFGANVANNFRFDSMNRSTNMILSLEQIFYTVDVSHPETVAGFFSNELSNAQIRAAIPHGIRPAYVSSVVYGRRVVISIQSNFNKQRFQNELNASFRAFGTNTSVTSELDIMSQAESTHMSAFVYGGSAQDAAAIIAAVGSRDFNAIMHALAGDFDPMMAVGTPIAVRLSNLDGSLAATRSSDEYTVKRINYLNEKLINWDHLDELVDSRELAAINELRLDFGSINTNFGSLIVANRTISIPANIERIHLYGGNDLRGERIIQNMTFNILNRAGPIKIELDNVSFTGHNNSAIRNENFTLTTILVNGNVTLQAASNHAAVNVGNLKIAGLSEAGNFNLTLIGGNASNNNNIGGAGINASDVNIVSTHVNNRISITGGGGRQGQATNSATVALRNGSAGGAAILSTGNVTIVSNAAIPIRLYGGAGGNAHRPSDSNNSNRDVRHGGSGGAAAPAISARNVVNVQNVIATGGGGGNAASGANATSGNGRQYGGVAGAIGLGGVAISSTSTIHANSTLIRGQNGATGTNGSNYSPSCVADGTQIKLANGTTVAVEDLRGDEWLKVFCFKRGTFSTAQIVFVDSGARQYWETIKLHFANDIYVKIIDSHAFFSMTYNRYVRITAYNVQYFVGHDFLKYTTSQSGDLVVGRVALVYAEVIIHYTATWNPITAGNFAFFANGVLSAPGIFARTGFLNIFEICPETLRYCEEAFQDAIDNIGLLTLEEFRTMLPNFPAEMFYAFNGPMLSIMVELGHTTWQEIFFLIESFSDVLLG